MSAYDPVRKSQISVAPEKKKPSQVGDCMSEPVKKQFNWMIIFWVIVAFLTVAYFVQQ
jgi:hypothetical protein